MKSERGKLKKVFVFIPLLLFCYSSSFGQLRLENLSLKDSNRSVMIAGWDNYIKVSSSNAECNFSMKAKNSYVYEEELNNVFRVRNKKLGFDTLSVYSQGKLIERKIYEVKKKTRNDFSPYIFDPESWKLTISEILSDPLLRLPYGFCKLYSCEIISFSLVIVKTTDEVPLEISKCYGPKIPLRTQEKIKELKPGDRIYFEDVKAIGPDKIARSLNGLSILII